MAALREELTVLNLLDSQRFSNPVAKCEHGTYCRIVTAIHQQKQTFIVGVKPEIKKIIWEESSHIIIFLKEGHIISMPSRLLPSAKKG